MCFIECDQDIWEFFVQLNHNDFYLLIFSNDMIIIFVVDSWPGRKTLQDTFNYVWYFYVKFVLVTYSDINMKIEPRKLHSFNVFHFVFCLYVFVLFCSWQSMRSVLFASPPVVVAQSRTPAPVTPSSVTSHTVTSSASSSQRSRSIMSQAKSEKEEPDLELIAGNSNPHKLIRMLERYHLISHYNRVPVVLRISIGACETFEFLDSMWSKQTICRSKNWSPLVQVMACRLFGTWTDADLIP